MRPAASPSECEAHAIGELAAVEPLHVATFIKELQGEFSPPTVKQHLAALRMLFDWLVTGHVIEARALLDAIDTSSLIGLRDRALIGVMVYSFARINAVLAMRVGDYFVQGRRGCVRLHEKGGKEHEVPCHHNLEQYLDEYIAADRDGPLFRTAAGKTGLLTRNAMWQQDAYRMIQRRAETAAIKTRIGNHTFRATGITAYLKNKGLLEHAQVLANHASPRTTKLYDRLQDEISLDEVEKISI